jgi:hypothetical protein
MSLIGHKTDMPTCLAKVRYQAISGPVSGQPRLFAVQVYNVINTAEELHGVRGESNQGFLRRTRRSCC